MDVESLAWTEIKNIQVNISTGEDRYGNSCNRKKDNITPSKIITRFGLCCCHYQMVVDFTYIHQGYVLAQRKPNDFPRPTDNL